MIVHVDTDFVPPQRATNTPCDLSNHTCGRCHPASYSGAVQEPHILSSDRRVLELAFNVYCLSWNFSGSIVLRHNSLRLEGDRLEALKAANW
jgi:hypothetical protein